MKRKRPRKYFHKIVILSVLLLLHFNNATGQADRNWNPSFKKCWEYPAERISNLEYESDNGLTFITSPPDTIQTLNLNSGKALWKSSLGGEIIGEIVTSKNDLVVLIETAENENGSVNATENNGNTKRSLISLDSVSGVTNWKETVNSTGKIFLYGSENLLLLVEEKGIVNTINLQDGKTLRRFDLKEEISAIRHFSNTLILGTREKKIVFFSIPEAKPGREILIEEIPTEIFMIDIETIIWADKKGIIRFVNAATQKTIWKKRFGGEISSIAKTSNGVLISSFDNFIYLVDLNNGKIKWKKRLAGRIIEEPLAFERFVAAFAYGDLSGLILDLNNGRTIDLITLSDINNQFIGKPIYVNNLLIFPTLKGVFGYSSQTCREK